MMGFSLSSLLSSLFFSTIAIWLFKESKRRQNIKLILVSIAMFAYSYFVNSPWLDWGIGCALCGLSYYWWE